MALIIRDTADIRMKILDVWSKFNDKKMSIAEVRAHCTLARTVLESLRVELTAQVIAQQQVPPLSVTQRSEAVQLTHRKQ